jgi:asparagine synthase (glutamine-hydrolysing)
VLLEMMDRLEHRGPDGRGVHDDAAGDLLLGHCRLAIMDPHGGAQPLYNEDGSATLVANGEIYNFPALREHLAGEHRFQTNSDNEAILHLFEEQGPAAVATLDGMFAFALRHGSTLYLARDPIGIKPLYYGRATAESGASVLYFASEQKALMNVVERVHEFPPGVYFDSSRGFVRYYNVPELTPQPMPLRQRLAELRAALEAAVARHLMSDVPVGVFLSGGLDSSLIAAIARRHVDKLHTFSVGIEGAQDLEAARVVADHIGSIHHEYVYTRQEVVACLPEIIYYLESYDQDLVRSAIPCYFCARLAADYVKVILTGEGADELFAGYRYYHAYTEPGAFHRELRRSVTSLHNINLQRVDRLTMCHGVEARVPFINPAMVELAQTIPPDLKLTPTRSGRQIEKWILRQACKDLLPPAILWREKAQFDEGSGTLDLLAEALPPAIGVNGKGKLDVAGYRALYPEATLRSPEECFYHQLFVAAYERPQALLDNVAHWSTARTATNAATNAM